MLNNVFFFLILFSPLVYGADIKVVLFPLQALIFGAFLIHFKNPAKQISFSAFPPALWFSWAGLAFLFSVSTLFSVCPDLSLKLLTYFFALSACFILAARGCISKKQVFFLCGVMIFSADLQVIIGVMQKMELLPHRHWIPRDLMAGTFVNHNRFSSLLEITLPIVFTFLFCKEENRYFRFFLIVSLVLQVGGLIMAQSRAGWISAVAGGLYFFIAASEKIKFKQILGGVLVILLISTVFVAFNQEAVGKRFKTLLALEEDLSAQARIEFWKAGFKIIRDHPLIGTGPGTVPLVFPKYRPENVRYYVNQLHNDYLGWMAEAGVFTLPCLCVMMLVFVMRPWRERKNFLAVAAGSAVLAMGIHSLVDYNLRIPAIAFYLAVLTGFSFRREEGSSIAHLNFE